MPRYLWIAAIVSSALLAGAPARAQRVNADSIVEACARQDTSTAWKHTGEAFARAAAARTPRDTALRRRLLALGDSDQALRLVPGLADSAASPGFVRRMQVRDSADEATLRAIVRAHGWPTISMVGADGAHAAWMIAQHNPDYEREALRLILALPPDEVSPNDLATLQDRVLVHQGKPQRYGTQLSMTPDGRMRFDPIEDVPGLDQRRAQVALPPIPVYACMVKGLYGREVVGP